MNMTIEIDNQPRDRLKSMHSDVSSSYVSSNGTRKHSSSWPIINFESMRRKKSMASSSTIAVEEQYCGWLWVRSSKLSRWRNRYFCLNGTMLSYYATFPSEEFLRQASTSQESAMFISDGTQPLDVMRVAYVDDTNNRLGFKVYGTSGKMIDVRAPRVDLRNEWLRALKTPARCKSRSWSVGSVDDFARPRSSSGCTESSISTPDRESIPILKSGWMMKRSDFLKRWNRYFFVIQGKMLSYHASDKPYEVPRRRGYVEAVSVVRGDKSVHELQIRLQGQAAIIVRIDSEEELEDWRTCILECINGPMHSTEPLAPSSSVLYTT